MMISKLKKINSKIILQNNEEQTANLSFQWLQLKDFCFMFTSKRNVWNYFNLWSNRWDNGLSPQREANLKDDAKRSTITTAVTRYTQLVNWPTFSRFLTFEFVTTSFVSNHAPTWEELELSFNRQGYGSSIVNISHFVVTANSITYTLVWKSAIFHGIKTAIFNF